LLKKRRVKRIKRAKRQIKMADLLLIELPGDAGLRLIGRLPTNQRSQLPGRDGLGGKKAGRPVLLMTSGRRTKRTVCPASPESLPRFVRFVRRFLGNNIGLYRR
jgi:hypothetical protein